MNGSRNSGRNSGGTTKGKSHRLPSHVQPTHNKKAKAPLPHTFHPTPNKTVAVANGGKESGEA
jgi:hypothetical protein